MANLGNKLDTADVESSKLKEMLEIERALRAGLDRLRAEQKGLLQVIVDAQKSIMEANNLIKLQHNLVVFMQGQWSGKGSKGP
jgi:hypothetical protein